MTEPQRIQPIVVVTDLWQVEEIEAQRFMAAPEPVTPSDPVPLRHDTARAMWGRYARPSRPISRAGRP